MSKVLELKKLKFVYKSSDNNHDFTIYLDNLELFQGEVVAITGVSGSGKSTLLECIGLLREGFEAERFCLGDFDLKKISETKRAGIRASKIGFMPQSGGLLPYLNLEENLALQIKLALKKNCEKKQVLERLNELKPLLDEFSISEHLKSYPKDLSIGQRQRAVFFRSLSHKPNLVLIDEPTSALDPINAHRLFETILKTSQVQKIAALIVTHDLALVSDFNLRTVSYDPKKSSDRVSFFSDEIRYL